MLNAHEIEPVEDRFYASRSTAATCLIVVSGGILCVLLALNAQLAAAIGVAAISAALAAAVTLFARRLFRFDRWIARRLKGTNCAELILYLSLPHESRTGKFAPDGEVEARLCELIRRGCGTTPIAAERAINLTVTAVTVVILSIALIDDYERSQPNDFPIPYRPAINVIVDAPEAPDEPTDADPSTPARGNGGNGADNGGGEAGDGEQGGSSGDTPDKGEPYERGDPNESEPPTDEWTGPSLDPDLTPGAVTDLMPLETLIETLEMHRARLSDLYDSIGEGEADPAGGKEALDIAEGIDGVLNELDLEDFVPEDVGEAIEKTRRQAERVIDAAKEAFESPTPENIARLLKEIKDLLSLLQDLLPLLESWAQEIASFLEDLLGDDSGFSQKTKDLFNMGMQQLESQQHQAAETTLEQLRDRLRKEMGRIKVKVSGMPEVPKDDPGGGTISPEGNDDPSERNAGERGNRRDGDPGEVDDDRRLKNGRGRGASEYPSSVG